jgi:hypothetical protein
MYKLFTASSEGVRESGIGENLDPVMQHREIVVRVTVTHPATLLAPSSALQDCNAGRGRSDMLVKEWFNGKGASLMIAWFPQFL